MVGDPSSRGGVRASRLQPSLFGGFVAAGWWKSCSGLVFF